MNFVSAATSPQAQVVRLGGRRLIAAIAILWVACATDRHVHAQSAEVASVVHHAIWTTSPAAQVAFDEGLTRVYAFDYDGAIRAFERAAELDPASPMPHWGTALALGPSINDLLASGRLPAAHAAVQRALERTARAPARERAYVDALAQRYSNDPAKRLPDLYRAYADAMRAVATEEPDDPDAATLFAESLMLSGRGPLWLPDGSPGDGAVEAKRTLERVLEKSPHHLGAAHHYIHLVETSATPEQGLAAAEHLDRSAINGHLLHMPSHIYVRIGDFRRAVASNRKAVAFDDKESASRPHVTHGSVGGYMSLQAHSKEFLAATACLTGQRSLALRTLTNQFILLRFGLWSEVLRAPRPTDPVAHLEWHIARVISLTATGALDAAADARREYDRFEQTMPTDARWWSDPMVTFLPVARHEMAARLAWARNDRDTAITEWREAVAAQDRLTPGEVPPWPWFHSTRESLGAALFVTGRAAEAAQVFREDLARFRGNPRSLFGLWKALERLGRADAAEVRDTFRVAWADAEYELTMDALL